MTPERVLELVEAYGGACAAVALNSAQGALGYRASIFERNAARARLLDAIEQLKGLRRDGN